MKQSKESRQQYHLTCKLLVLQKYGGKCAYCNENEIAILTIDHKNNDGCTERKKHSCSRQFYFNLRINPIREDLQILCFNCQWRKRIYGSDFATWEQSKITTDAEPKPLRKYRHPLHT